MAKLRRTNRDSYQIPVAADELEMRSMLSAGVHGAIAHAHHSIHEAAAPKPVVVNFAGPFHAQVNATGLGTFQFDGNFSKASVTLGVGKSYAVSFSQALNLNVGGAVIKGVAGALKGKVAGISDHVVDIIPSGKVTVTIAAGGHTLKVPVAPKPGSHATLTLNGSNQFVSLTGTFSLPASLGGGDVGVTLTP